MQTRIIARMAIEISSGVIYMNFSVLFTSFNYFVIFTLLMFFQSNFIELYYQELIVFNHSDNEITSTIFE